MAKNRIWETIKGIARKLNVFRYARNLFLCLRYPFLRWYGDPLFPNYPQLRRFSLDWTWLDEIPIGWRKAFGMKMARELRKVGKSEISEFRKSGRKATWGDILNWCQIKEKWGELVLDAFTSHRMMHVLDKYKVMSLGYCMDCGEKARYKTQGSVEFCCERCFERHYERWHMTKDEIASLKKDCRLGVDDIPKHTRYEYTPIRFEHFDSFAECDERLNSLSLSNGRPKNENYESRMNLDGTWTLTVCKRREIELDFVEEYGIDLKSLWGLDEEEELK